MIPGMSTSAFALLRVIPSLIGIASFLIAQAAVLVAVVGVRANRLDLIY